MKYSSRQAAKKIGLHLGTLQKYIAEGKIPVPPLLEVGAGKLRIWTDADIAKVQEVLPKIANGRKTRYKKQTAKTKAQPKSAVPHKKKSSKKPKPPSG
jgi:predicted site-specific integrase-resolvase